MTADPPVPADGRCIVCARPRRLAGVKLLYRQAAETDPFCSNTCARFWHGYPLPVSRYEPVTRGG